MEVTQLINDFNNEAISFSLQIGKLCPKSTIAKNLNYIKSIIKNNPQYVINQFTLHILKYKNQIDNYEEKFFTDNDFSDEATDNSVISIIFEFKSIWSELSEDQKTGIFQVMQILCHYSQEYFINKF